MYIKDIGWNVWSDGNPQVYIKDIGMECDGSDGNPQVYIKDIGWNVWSDGQSTSVH